MLDIIWLVVGGLLLLSMSGNPKYALVALTFGAQLAIVNPLYKGIVQRLGIGTPRPLSSENGMPSGHAAASACAVIVAAAVGLPQYAIGLLVLAAMYVFCQRVVNQKHTPLQVVAGMMQGIADGLLATCFIIYFACRSTKARI